MKHSRASGLTVETKRDFGLGATGTRLLVYYFCRLTRSFTHDLYYSSSSRKLVDRLYRNITIEMHIRVTLFLDIFKMKQYVI